MLRQQMWIPGGVGPQRPRWRLLRLLLAGGLVALLILGAAGYVILARFATTQLILTGGLIILTLMLHQLGREFIRQGICCQA